MKELTRRQKEVLDIIERHVRTRGYPPSMREITAELKLASAAGIHKHIKALERKGYLTKEKFLSRSLRVVGEERPQARGSAALQPRPEAPGGTRELPLVGTIAAGQPIEAIEQRQETLPVPAALLGTGRGTHYVLRVSGNSMQDEGILDGDYVVVEARQTARNGEVVVALLHGQEATLKRLYTEGAQVRLQPANAAMAPIVVPGGDVEVQGVAVGIWRRF